MKKLEQINIRSYKSDGFIKRYQKLVKDVVIPYQYNILHDRIDGVEKSHVVSNFINAAKALRGEDVGDGYYGMVFQDSDAAKWLEAAAYSLTCFPDRELEEKADRLIEIIGAAQDSDGYLNTYFTVKDRDKRWKNLLEGHELYCAGHMMEAAVAYYEATGKDVLLNIMLKNAEHIYRHFITEKAEGYPGHPEVELALMKMYRATGNKHCLELAEHFIDVRGKDPFFYEKEVASRDWKVWGNDAKDHNYQQSAAPVREQENATGHSVRAVYLYTGMADLASYSDDELLKSACRRLWKNITEKRMYVTGAIGSTVLGEAFTEDFDLPNDTVYGETCASIGLMFFASRMLENEPDSQYSDVMERAFCNTVLAGMQLDGKRFFYVNPLEVVPSISGTAATKRHILPERPSWYTCACCPPNVARLIMSLGKYAYGENETTCFCHLFAAGEVEFKNGMKIRCDTEFPYGFSVDYEIINGGKELSVRIPDWSRNIIILKNGTPAEFTEANGYAYLGTLESGDVIRVLLDDSVKFVYPSAKIAADSGFAAIQRGALVYCFEGTDNGDVISLSLSNKGGFSIGVFDENLLNGTVKIEAQGFRTETVPSLYSYEKPKTTAETLTAIPYYTWGNRGKTQMRVWLPLKD